MVTPLILQILAVCFIVYMVLDCVPEGLENGALTEPSLFVHLNYFPKILKKHIVLQLNEGWASSREYSHYSTVSDILLKGIYRVLTEAAAWLSKELQRHQVY